MQITGTELHLLAVFDSVVRNNGFSAAQAELGLSQPTISNHISALEQRLGVKLCDRGRRGFLLTDKGQIVHELSQSLLVTIKDHASKFAALKGNLVGHLRIAVVDCLATDPKFRVPQAIRDFTKVAPAVKIEMSIEDPQDILVGLRDGSFHVGVGGFDNFLNGLKFKQIYDEKHALYCGEGHELFLAKEEELEKLDLSDYAWAQRGYWSRQRQRSRPATDYDVSVQEIESQIMLILSGCYLGLLPCHAAEYHLQTSRMRQLPFDDEHTSPSIYIVTKSGVLPSVTEQFVRLLAAEYK